MKRFEGKAVLVTGGTSGIGLAAAKAFFSEGARVVITGRDKTALGRAQTSIGAGTLAIGSDIADPTAGKAFARELQAQCIRLDAVFANAGITRFAPFPDVTQALWDESFNTNVKGAYFLLQALLPLINDGASIVLNGSVNAHMGMPGSSVYAASKAALISLAKTLSGELIGRKIRVNVVSPGPISTPLYGKLGLDAAELEATAASIKSQIPLGRFGSPEELAATVLHLAAPESAFVVGTEIVVDGGMTQL